MDVLLKSDDRYYSLMYAREGAQRWYDCGKVPYPDIFFEDTIKRAHLIVAPMYPGASEWEPEAPLEVIFAYIERSLQHMKGRASDWSSVDAVPCNQIAGGFPPNSIPVTFLPGES